VHNSHIHKHVKSFYFTVNKMKACPFQKLFISPGKRVRSLLSGNRPLCHGREIIPIGK
jgi:hypothetical protein